MKKIKWLQCIFIMMTLPLQLSHSTPTPIPSPELAIRATAPTLSESSYVVVATVYQGVEGQTDSTPTITATGDDFDPISPPRWIAVSRDLLPIFPYGTVVHVENAGVHTGYYKVMDTMAKYKELNGSVVPRVRQIDILVSTLVSKGHPQYGKWYGVKITKVT